MSDWHVSTELTPEDRDIVFRWIGEESYWTKGLPRTIFDRSLAHSLCFGLRNLDGSLKGFARVVSDRATFAYLSDVFICPTMRGQGAGKFLISAVLAFPELQQLRRWMLATRDAHGLYETFGFAALPDPSLIMVRNDPDVYARLAGGSP